MAVRKMTTSEITSNLWYKSMLAGNPAFIPAVDVGFLVIAGGGGGGCGFAPSQFGGAGGAGGYRSSITGESSGGGASAESTLTLAPSTNYTVTVGAGGAGNTYAGGVLVRNGNQGSNSVFSTITSIGGGLGGGQDGSGGNGGSGGGAGPYGGGSSPGGSGTANQGFAGASNSGGNGGAGGGAGSAASGTTRGNGVASSVTGTSVTRAVGGLFNSGAAGTANTGNGGGGGPSEGNAGAGGSGVVILRYPNTYTITIGAGLTGTTATVGANKVTTITAGTGNVSWA